jgi:hypothetical protein
MESYGSDEATDGSSKKEDSVLGGGQVEYIWAIALLHDTSSEVCRPGKMLRMATIRIKGTSELIHTQYGTSDKGVKSVDRMCLLWGQERWATHKSSIHLYTWCSSCTRAFEQLAFISLGL